MLLWIRYTVVDCLTSRGNEKLVHRPEEEDKGSNRRLYSGSHMKDLYAVWVPPLRAMIEYLI